VRITIKKIAQDLGISHSTVSRVLNDKHSNLISESTRERIMEAARRMGYRPNRIAQALQGKSTQLIGIFVPDTDDQFFQTVIKHLRRTLEECDYELMVFVSTPNQITATWHRLLQWDLDGVFVFDYLFYVDGLWEALTQHSGPIPPVVGLFSSKTQLKDYVTIDFRPALETLLAHLLEQGCRRFGYMAFPTSFHPSEQRYAVFSEFVTRHDLPHWDIPILYGQPSLMEAARQGMSAWIAEGQPLPDALFCQNDEIGLGAYRALYEAGIPVPDRIALAGCDDLPYISYLETPLTSLTLPVQEVCRQGWSLLQKRIADPESAAMQIVLEVGLSLRASCQKQESHTG
jgi:LacI family transcriptional regulator